MSTRSDPAAQLARLQSLVGNHGTGGAFQALDPNEGRELIAALADAKHAPAAPLLAELASDPTPYSASKRDAVAALRVLGVPAAEAIVARLVRVADEGLVPWDPYHPTLFAAPMLEALFAADTMDPFDRLAPFFVPARVATPAGARIACDVLSVVTGRFAYTAHQTVALLHPDAAPAVRIGDDPRWIDRIVRLLGDRRLRLYAKNALKSLAPMAVQEAYVRVAGPKQKPVPAPPPDPAAVASAERAALRTARAVRAALEQAASVMKAAKYTPRAKGKCLGEVDVKAAEVRLAEIEGITKAQLPELVRALYLVVGPIDFQRPFDKTPPDALARFAAAPRLQIVALDRALKDLKARRREIGGIPLPLRGALALDLSEDAAVCLEPWCADPLMEGSDETLSAYLRRRIAEWAIMGLPEIPSA